MPEEPLPKQSIQLRCPRCRNLVPFRISRQPRVDVQWVETTTMSDVAPSALMVCLDATVYLRSGHSC